MTQGYALCQASTRALSLPRRSTALTTMASAAPSRASSGTAQSTRDAGATAKRHWLPKRDQIAYIEFDLPAASLRYTDGPLRTAATDGATGASSPSHGVAGTSAGPG